MLVSVSQFGEILLLMNVSSYLGIVCVVLSSVAVAEPPPYHGIEAHRWRIAKYLGGETQDGDDKVLIEATKATNITFTEGRVHGSAGCGGLAGTYRLSGDRLVIQAGLVLAGACTREGSVQNRLILAALNGDLRIEQKDDQILLREKSGKPRLLLVPLLLVP